MIPPTISVALINYNNSRYLTAAIDSVLGQTRLPDELIISDDGSTDDSIEIIRRYMHQYSIIKLIQNPVNLGASGNRDSAIRHASSLFVINLDSDDWFEPEVIDRTLEALTNAPDAFVISNFRVVSDDGALLTDIETSDFCAQSFGHQIFLLAKRDKKIPGNQFAFSRETYLKIGGLNPKLRLYEDWDLCIRATLHKIQWVHTGIVGFNYRKSGHGLSSAGQMRHMKYRLRVIFANLFRSRFNPGFIAGVILLFTVKGFKYLTGVASPYGYN